ncbi:MAG: hypothetical protein KGI71_06560 [Patescibacteria group bacterium]|nr:hypothetical protein [Patescibacteria group bacterium]
MSALDVILSVVGFFLTVANGWLILLVRRFQEDIDKLRETDKAMEVQVNQIHLLVAGDYITRSEFQSMAKDLRNDFKESLQLQTDTLLRHLKDAVAALRYRGDRDNRNI